MATTYGSIAYCDIGDAAQAGYHWLLCIFTADAKKLLAVAGQDSLSITRSADSTEVTSKLDDGWKSYIAGEKSWSIDTEGAFIIGADSMQTLRDLYEAGDLVCCKVIDMENEKDLFGGLATITDFSLDAPYDDAVTYSLSLQGSGKLVDFTSDGGSAEDDGFKEPDGE